MWMENWSDADATTLRVAAFLQGRCFNRLKGASVARGQVDPSKLEGVELERWYRRTPDEIEQERQLNQQALYSGFFGELASPREPSNADETWQEARVAQPRTRAPVSPPRPSPARRERLDPQRRGPAEIPRGRIGGFFDQAGVVPNPSHGPAYYSDLPRPLNVVEPQLGGWFRLNDGSLVQADELERLYGEQQRVMAGEDEFEPAPRVRPADRLKDGFIPRADQLTKEDREMDASCHPYGGWELDRGYPHYSERTQRYEAQITGAPGLDYVVRLPDGRVVKFDGCGVRDPRRPLLEAKGEGLAGVEDASRRHPGIQSPVNNASKQAERQLGVAQGRPVEWHAAERRFFDLLGMTLRGRTPATFELHHTPAR